MVRKYLAIVLKAFFLILEAFNADDSFLMMSDISKSLMLVICED
ncbi:hypothetical protein [Methanobrevibacter sp.]|nr:hypothetical protein [Methanobrevibacter sp.]